MKERIKQVAVQSGIQLRELQTIGAFILNHVTVDELERFAELIVRECIDVCQSRVGNSDYNTGRMHCTSDIKEHFGVKE